MIREMLKPKIANEYREFRLICTCDPAGTARSQTDEISCLGFGSGEGFEVTPASTNNFGGPQRAVVYFLTRTVDGKPALVVSPNARCSAKDLWGTIAIES